ncbi:MAG: hypothetical protein ABWY06_14690 [Pseudomonas sp.]|uniref:hypothetical protein n=1 Tax=Pseudomonas sp. TaxID=306 RepID=UPI003399D1BF
MDKDDFVTFLDDYLNKHKRASAFVPGAEAFVDQAYAAYLENAPKNKKTWIAEYLQDKFVFSEQPPRWQGEPDWPFFQGQPMVFLHQFSLGLECAKSLQGAFPMGDTLYVFGSKNPPNPTEGQTWETIYRMLGQDNDGGYTEHLKYARED